MAVDTQITISEQQRILNLETALFGGSAPEGGVVKVVPTVYSGTQDVLSYPGVAVFSSTTVDASSLATQVVGIDDGKLLVIMDGGGASHTVTTATGKIVSGSTQTHKTLTFNGNQGATVTLQAWNGLWFVQNMSVSPNGVAIS